MADCTVALSNKMNGRVYWPHPTDSRDPSSPIVHWQNANTPIIVFLVGGGWEMRNVDHNSYQVLARSLANRGWIILLPEFRRVGLGYSYLYTLLPLHFSLFLCSFALLWKPCPQKKLYVFIEALVVSILVCFFFFIGADTEPVCFETQIADCTDALQWTQTIGFQSLFRFKPRNVFLMGYSSGATLASIVHLQQSPLLYYLKGCISVCGMMNENVVYRWSWMLWFWSGTIGLQNCSQLLPLSMYNRQFLERNKTRSAEKILPLLAPMMIVTGSHESPTLQKSAFDFAYQLSVHHLEPVEFLHLYGRDHWTILDDLLNFNHNQKMVEKSTSKPLIFAKPLLYHLNNFVLSHLS